jgi:hypothetical protein
MPPYSGTPASWAYLRPGPHIILPLCTDPGLSPKIQVEYVKKVMVEGVRGFGK